MHLYRKQTNLINIDDWKNAIENVHGTILHMKEVYVKLNIFVGDIRTMIKP